MRKFIDPRIDFAFKKIFGSEDAKDILISFIESVMKLDGDRKIRDIVFQDPYLPPKVKTLKTTVLDIKCTDHLGVCYLVEMQMLKVRAFLRRIQYNAAKAYANQITVGQDYPKLNQVVAITVTDFTLFEEFPHYLSCHLMSETETGKNFLTEIMYYFVELSKFGKTLSELDSPIDRWAYFMKKAGELDNIPAGFDERPFSDAFERARVANMDPDEYEEYDKCGIATTDAQGAIEYALEKGLKEGMEKGIEKGIYQTARNMLNMGLDMKIVCQATGLTQEELGKII
jgi:predicted transposase/invertase (TIGR01784 family)